jgi:hypothetical protein
MTGFYGHWPPTAEEGRMADALSRGESVPGGPGACGFCGHLTLWHGDHGRYNGRPCRRCGCPSFIVPGDDGPRTKHGTPFAHPPSEQLALFGRDEIA